MNRYETSFFKNRIMLNKTSRNLFILASLILIGAYFFPLWQITLEAPQYPEGIALHIWHNKIGGETEYTLQNINILNHYIGMRQIVPESFTELKVIPWVIASFTVLGLIFAFLRKRKYLFFWLLLFAISGLIGIYDFYLWEYDYGHNLDPNAPIKVPGMAYQPPLFGEKMLLNFKASSYPHWGGIIVVSSVMLAFFAYILDLFKSRKFSVKPTLSTAALSLLLIVQSCTPQQSPIEFGKDSCSYCKMSIVDQQYGAEIVTPKGKVFKYDAVECMINAMCDDERVKEVHASYVVNHDNPKELIDATSSLYLFSKELPSPMGEFLTAFKTQVEAEKSQEKYKGDLLNLDGVRELLTGKEKCQ
nr:nitrous-oxide reductase accessory protein [uncultured bacterium]